MSQQFSSLLPMSFNPVEHDLLGVTGFITKSGKYPVVIHKAYMKTSSEATSNYLCLELKIIGGEFDGIVLVDRVNIMNQSIKAREYAVKQLTSYCTAVGISSAFNDAAILVGRRLQVFVNAAKEPSKDNPDVEYWKNEITDRFYADGTELVRGNWGGQQQPQQGGFAPAPQQMAQPQAPQPQAPQPMVQQGYAQPAMPVAPQPVAPQPVAQPQYDPNQYAQQPQQYAQPVQQPQPPTAPVAPVVPQQPQVAPVSQPQVPQGGFAPPAAGTNPSFAPPPAP